MNKKETAEIKKNFSDKSGFFIMERVLTGFIDAEKNLRYHHVNSCLTMPVEEHDVYDETLKKVLNTNVGKSFVEYEFPNEAYEEGKPQEMLYTLLRSELKDEVLCENFLNHIANNIAYTGPFAVITAYCTYTIRKKDKNDEYAEGEDEIYNYLLTAICPVNTGSDGFVFDSFNNEIMKKMNTELIISKAPSDGFLYPVFSNRSSDINHVMYYAKSASKPNISVIEDVLGCTFVMSAENEKANFQSILKNVVGDDLDYMVIKTVNEKIQEVVEENKEETDKTVIDDLRLKDILTDIGVPQERVEMVAPVFEKVCGNTPLTASNLVENKTVLAAPGITVNIKPSAADKVRTSVVDGRRCLLIDIDDPTIEINGLPVTLS
ncbi:DUF4317 domain-containing protein [Ruminococcus sp. XPD3002]|uniref:DUF4317 domain-containing protein n=1 Tax=Ruminococcus sp. XPD3002 TaxID=1452269 RepID=UPI0009247827|nr:DUF4317 domain-containing protein [Ruminococcus sp.]SFX32972.1 protein of unknown function [Ruminococcus flavefaciens]HRU97325.1 DUF4317 domain-containing protein [Ruminococcus sp.]